MNARSTSRVAGLTLSLTGLAVVFGMLQAPQGVKAVGALVGLVIGFPVAALLAVLLRKKDSLVAFWSLFGVIFLLALLSVYLEVFRNPLTHLGAVVVAGTILSFLLPEKLPTDPNHCPSCGYPIGASKRCSECGATVTPRHAPNAARR